MIENITIITIFEVLFIYKIKKILLPGIFISALFSYNQRQCFLPFQAKSITAFFFAIYSQ